MSSFQQVLREYLATPEDVTDLTNVLDQQASEVPVGATVKLDTSTEWNKQKERLLELFAARTDESIGRALKLLAKMVDTLELYSPTLKGLQEVHGFATEHLEQLVFDQKIADKHAATAAYLYGQAMAMSTITAEAIAPAIDTMLIRNDAPAANIALCVLLGVEQSNSPLFESNLPILLRQVQIAAFAGVDRIVSQEALLGAMRVYSPTEKAASCTLILQSVHALLVASLRLCEVEHTRSDGVAWACYIIEHTPIMLRLDLQRHYPQTCNAVDIFSVLSSTFGHCSTSAHKALCRGLPILTTWSTPDFVAGTQVRQMVEYMLSMCATPQVLVNAMKGLGQLSNVVLDRFAPFMDDVGAVALRALTDGVETHRQGAQQLLGRLLAALGPITLDTMVEYLRSLPDVLLADVKLLESIAILLPKLSPRIILTMTEIIDDLIHGRADAYEHEAVLAALNVFPLDDPVLAQKAQSLVLWSLNEERGKGPVMAALQLSINPFIAHHSAIQPLTFKAAQLLLADDPHIVHLALNVLSNPTLASMLDERSCSMILLALHQSIEPSIQIVAAKLLTHLTTAHRAIVQPLAWSHIRQSLSLMDFLQSVDPTRAIVEACIISNLLPALPKSLHKKYVGPVKQLILSGLEHPQEGTATLSLVFQGLANLAKFEGWGATQQSNLASDLLDMTQEIPKDSQHAALNAISRLLSIPTEGLEVYNLLIKVHATFGGRGNKLDPDLKALVSAIYGHLGTVERNPVISRDSKAAINRETSVYDNKARLMSQVAEMKDKYGADHQTHINWLVTKNLLAAYSPTHKAAEERAMVLEVMTSFGILQPNALPLLIPDLPSLLFTELRNALHPKDGHRETTPVSAAILFLASALHISPNWLSEYWGEAADIMAEALKEGEVLPVLRGLGVILDAVVE